MHRLQRAKPQEMSAVMWGFARLGPACAPNKLFMEAVSHKLVWSMEQFGGQELSMVLWAMATLGYRPKRATLRAAELRLIALAPQLSAQDVGNSLWALGRMRFRAAELLEALPRSLTSRLHEFRPQEMSCLLYGYTHARHLHEPLLEAAVPVSWSLGGPYWPARKGWGRTMQLLTSKFSSWTPSTLQCVRSIHACKLPKVVITACACSDKSACCSPLPASVGAHITGAVHEPAGRHHGALGLWHLCTRGQGLGGSGSSRGQLTAAAAAAPKHEPTCSHPLLQL